MAAERHHETPQATGARRRARQMVRRRRRVEFSLGEEEYARVRAAARNAGLANGAYAARATLAAVQSAAVPAEFPFRDALAELIRASGLVRRIGVNLNQAVARLNTTGQRSGDLLPYAAATAAAATEQIREFAHADPTAAADAAWAASDTLHAADPSPHRRWGEPAPRGPVAVCVRHGRPRSVR